MNQRLLELPRTARAHTRTLTAFSRHGAIAAGRLLSETRVTTPARQLLMMVLGSSLIGFGVAAFRAGDLGLPPFDVLLSAIDARTGLSHGQAAWLVSGSLILVATVLGQRPRPSTLLFVLANGLAVDAAAQLIVHPDPLVAQMAMVGVGVATIAAGIAVVVHSGLTGGSFEMLMRAAEVRGLRPTTVRLGLEISVLAAGIMLGGDFGIATVVFALAIARAMSLVLQAMADHRRGRAARLVTAA
ncbi:MAG: hypothetical protein OEW42_11485 [Acidimicrobiia bacterium]|nr:hypothetical protein [Acidimicrobiia bacterium]MDH5236054.1 hypothetical protein [Acidimicrobiia bacterium]